MQMTDQAPMISKSLGPEAVAGSTIRRESTELIPIVDPDQPTEVRNAAKRSSGEA
jgi:hypothetical protein